MAAKRKENVNEIVKIKEKWKLRKETSHNN